MLNIVDRTSPRTVATKKVTPVTPVESVVIEAPISRADEYRKITESLLARRRRPVVAEKTVVAPPKLEKPVKSLVEVAEEIKASRLRRKPLEALPVAPPKSEFHCHKKSGESLTVVPTIHALTQFKWRYFIIDASFKSTTDAEIEAKMMEVFNSGKRIAYSGYLHRNQKRRDSTSAMVWGTKKMCFLIDTTTNTIITCELNGKYRKYNTAGYKNMIYLGIFDHSKLKVTK